MKSALKISAEEVINREPVTVSTDQSLSQVRNVMEDNDLRAVAVVNNGKLKGAISYRDMIRHVQFNPERTKLEEVMHQPPSFELEDSLVELADLRINSGRKLLVHEENGKLDGVIGDSELMNAFTETAELEDVTTRDIGSIDVIHVFEEDSIEKARHVMLDNNISRLPVLDQDGNLTGVIRSTDMLRLMVPRESIDSGGTSGRSLEDTQIAGSLEKEKMSDVDVNELMDRTPSTHDGHLNALEAAREMAENDTDDMLIVDGSYPEAMVTSKDFVDYLAEFSQRDTVLVQLTGLELPEEKAALHNKIETQLRGSLGRKLERPEELSVHVKKSEKDGKKHRYELIVKLYSEYGLVTINEEGWELLDVMDEALNELDSVIRKKKDKRSDH